MAVTLEQLVMWALGCLAVLYALLPLANNPHQEVGDHEPTRYGD